MKYLACALLVVVAGCIADSGDSANGDEDLVDTSQQLAYEPGVNGSECIASKYNCRFRAGSSRVENAAGDDSWAIVPGASVRDGDGNVLAIETGTHLTFNYGQTRTLAGKAHALAITSSNASAGWYPFDHIVSEASFRDHVGNVDAKSPHAGHMACYEIRATYDPALAVKKVVYDSQEGPDGHERAGDYLPIVRANGRPSANLVFSVPGFALGGATTDHFPAGTKFHRVNVPTDSGRPSISIPLWVQDGAGRYRRRSGSMRFVYGYIVGDGTSRFGWMAYDALQVSGGCP